jgi:uncharacterized protein DUF2760
MNRFILALKVFGRVLFHAELAPRAQELLADVPPARPTSVSTPAAPIPARAAPARSDAINLLAVLQREARLVDFLKENIASYDDAQIGAAVRDVHRSSAAVLDRLFSLRPLMNEPEGSSLSVPAGAEAGRVRMTGNVTGHPPYRGTLRHQGWEAAKVELPEWTGSADAARIVAPAEVEVG